MHCSTQHKPDLRHGFFISNFDLRVKPTAFLRSILQKINLLGQNTFIKSCSTKHLKASA